MTVIGNKEDHVLLELQLTVQKSLRLWKITPGLWNAKQRGKPVMDEQCPQAGKVKRGQVNSLLSHRDEACSSYRS